MSLLSLHLLGSPVLRQRSTEVGAVDDEVRRLVDDMYETMDAARGVGLAANQVGLARRVAVVDADAGPSGSSSRPPTARATATGRKRPGSRLAPSSTRSTTSTASSSSTTSA